MIESAANAIQLLLTGACSGIAAISAARTGRREWTLLSLFAGAYFLGDLYWLLYLVFYKVTPQYPLIPDFSFYASYLFLLLLTARMNERTGAVPGKALWLTAVFPAAMCLFYMQWGQYVSNVIYAFLMTLVLRRAAAGLLSLGKAPEKGSCTYFYRTVLLFCALEYGIWTSSCFWNADTLKSPYIWLELLFSFCFLLFPAALRKAETV